MNSFAVVVDPVLAGKYLPDEFNSRGIKCVSVLSKPLTPDMMCGYSPNKFEEIIIFDGDIESLVKRLAVYSPMCVMLGSETGLELADLLASRLGLAGNDPSSSASRCDKYEMHATLKTHGVRSANQHRADSLESAIHWLSSHDKWPVVVKPSHSAGSDNVFICRTLDQALQAVRDVLGAVNIFGRFNTCAVIQDFLEGREWVVDTVSCDGKHVVTNISRYLKTVLEDGSIVYRHAEFLSASNSEYSELVEYALRVNNALGVRYGAAHLEIIVTKDGPTLVELNARMHGCDAVKALKWCYPVTQLDLSVDAFISPDEFVRKSLLEFNNSKYMLAHYLIAEKSGTVATVIDTTELKNITSYRLHCLPSPGRIISKTVSLLTSPGNIWLLSETPETLWADQEKLIDMETNGKLFALALS